IIRTGSVLDSTFFPIGHQYQLINRNLGCQQSTRVTPTEASITSKNLPIAGDAATSSGERRRTRTKGDNLESFLGLCHFCNWRILNSPARPQCSVRSAVLHSRLAAQHRQLSLAQAE